MRDERPDRDDNGRPEDVRHVMGPLDGERAGGAAPEAERARPAQEGGGQARPAGPAAPKRLNPAVRSAGPTPHREHRWDLLKSTFSPEAGQTRLEWRCAHCLSDTFTNAPSSVGSHGAHNYLPGRRALQATWVPEDCDMALVAGVNDR